MFYVCILFDTNKDLLQVASLSDLLHFKSTYKEHSKQWTSTHSNSSSRTAGQSHETRGNTIHTASLATMYTWGTIKSVSFIQCKEPVVLYLSCLILYIIEPDKWISRKMPATIQFRIFLCFHFLFLNLSIKIHRTIILPILLPVLREEHRQMVSENKMLNKTCDHMKMGVTW